MVLGISPVSVGSKAVGGCSDSPELIWLCPHHGTCSKSEDIWDFQSCAQPVVIEILHNPVGWVVVYAVMCCTGDGISKSHVARFIRSETANLRRRLAN